MRRAWWGACAWVLTACSTDIVVFTPLDGGADTAPDAAIPADAEIPDAGSAPIPSSVLAAFEHTCAIRDGALSCWGDNDGGQLGTGDRSLRARPVALPEPTEAVQVCAAETHSCALARDGAAWCWGDNSLGQLGLGDREPRLTPTPIAGHRFREIACGGQTTCAVSAEAGLLCWGNNEENQVMAFDTGGEPQAVLVPSPVPSAIPLRHVGVGQGHVCAIDDAGALYCWGRNSNSQLGIPQSETIRVATPRRIGSAQDYEAVAAAQFHSCAIRQERRLFCWGANSAGQLGIPDALGTVLPPTQVPLAEVAEVATNWFHTCGLTLEGALYCWGRNVEGQLGTGETQEQVAIPVRVGSEQGWTHVATGRFHTCGVRQGTLYCWGKNEEGQLGIDAEGRRDEPTEVVLP